MIIQYLTLLSLHTITVLPLTIVYFVSEVHCTSNVLHSITPYYKCKGNSHITMITVQSTTIVLPRSTVDYHLIKLYMPIIVYTCINLIKSGTVYDIIIPYLIIDTLLCHII